MSFNFNKEDNFKNMIQIATSNMKFYVIIFIVLVFFAKEGNYSSFLASFQVAFLGSYILSLLVGLVFQYKREYVGTKEKDDDIFYESFIHILLFSAIQFVFWVLLHFALLYAHDADVIYEDVVKIVSNQTGLLLGFAIYLLYYFLLFKAIKTVSSSSPKSNNKSNNQDNVIPIFDENVKEEYIYESNEGKLVDEEENKSSEEDTSVNKKKEEVESEEKRNKKVSFEDNDITSRLNR